MNINNELSSSNSLPEKIQDLNEAEKIQNEENNKNDSVPQNISNQNQIIMLNKEKEIEELDETDNLGIKGNIPNNFNPFLQQRLDSCDSPMAPAHFKFSIDMPNVPKQRLHEYLNDDLLNALDVSPNIPNITSGITNNIKKESENIDNNPNNLFGFSLYPEKNENNLDNQNNNNNKDNNKEDINNNKDINKNNSNKSYLK